MLLTPGPVELTPEISRAQTREMIYHRTKEYREMHVGLIEKVRKLFRSDDGYVITGSGTAGIEASIVSMLGKEDVLFNPNNGKFGERIFEIARIFSEKPPLEQRFEYGKGIDLERVRATIDEKNPTILAMAYNETSTGVCNKIRDICLYAKKKGVITVIDGVSAVGGHELDMRGWGVDVCITGSQKCIGAPPGLALIGINKSAIEKIESNSPKAYYLSLKRYRKSQERSEMPYTPAISLLYSLDAALDLVLKEGIANRIERHRRAGELVRRGLREMGFALFAESGFESNTVTSFKTADADRIKEELKAKYGITIAGGQGEMKGKMLRIGHMANFTEEQLRQCLDAIKEIIAK